MTAPRITITPAGMLPPSIASQTIQIVRPVTRVVHGSEVPDWTQDPLETVTVNGCSVQPTGGSEDRSHRDQLGGQFRVYAPAGTSVGPLDRVWLADYPNQYFRLASEVQSWSPGFLNHVQLVLVAWEG